ncbi:MAG: hypothetical protein LBK13_12000, partial [Spirochaetales bacterium]|nr:hypothetical protein [Spirochaetales bacterium]
MKKKNPPQPEAGNPGGACSISPERRIQTMSGRHRTAHGGELILWHPAFCEAISMDLEPWKDVLEFKFEYELTTGPLKIDVLIIRKLTADPIKGNIATLFRE